MARHVTYIIVDDVLRGVGTSNDPMRRITQLFEFNGEQVAEWDPVEDKSWFIRRKQVEPQGESRGRS